jgi:hypothetical protein
MRRFLSVAVFLFALPASGQNYLGPPHKSDAECKGVVHGVVIGQDGKPWGGINVVLEPVGTYDLMLPHMKSDAHGQYRFSDVSCGSWGVFIEDKAAGYPHQTDG